MYKKARLTLKLSATDTPAVVHGDTVHPQDVLITPKKSEIDEFDIAKLLAVKPKDLSRYLTVKEGEMVDEGETIARKKTLLKKQIVRTPVSGEFKIIDKEKGIVGIKRVFDTENIVSWFSGTVVEVTPEKLIFELSGQPLEGKAGKGHPVSGQLLFLAANVELLSMPIELENRVLAIKEIHADMIAKADTLGVVAIVAESVSEPPFELPFVIVSDIAALEKHHNKTVIVYGDEKQVLIIEGKKGILTK